MLNDPEIGFLVLFFNLDQWASDSEMHLGFQFRILR